VTALRGDNSGFHACRSRPDNGDAFFCRYRFGLTVLKLATRFRKLNARYPVTAMSMADARLIATNTSANVVGPVFAGLDGEIWVADEGPDHPNHVRLSRGHCVFCLLGLIDSPSREDRNRDCVPDGLCER
jgi:hypothetical protein